MLYKFKYQFYLLLVTIIYLCGCDLAGEEGDDTGTEESVWENLGLPVEAGYELFIAEGDLYVAAGYDGLYYLEDSNLDNEWQYLGHKVTEGERSSTSGVQTLDVHNDQIIIRSNEKIDVADSSRYAGVWISNDLGNTWKPYDDGFQTELHESFLPSDIVRSPHDKNILLAGAGTVFRKDLSNEPWIEVHPKAANPAHRPYSDKTRLIWNPHNENQAWLMDESRGEPYLGWTWDNGTTWDFTLTRQPSGKMGNLSSMAFDAVDPNVIYGSMNGEFVRSVTQGMDWIEEDSAQVISSPGIVFLHLEPHTKKSGIIFGSSISISMEEAVSLLYVTIDGGETFSELEVPDEVKEITDLWFSSENKSLYISSTNGVFSLSNPIVDFKVD